MGLVAVITRERPIGLEEWTRHVANDEALVVPAARDNRARRPMAGEVAIVLRGATVGEITPASEPGNGLGVYALPTEVEEIRGFVSRLAQVLGGDVLWLADDEP